MTVRAWQVRLTSRAEADFADIIDWTWDSFGRRQAEAYATLLLRGVRALEDGPHAAATRDRASLQPHLRSLQPRRARHVLLFRVQEDASGVTPVRAVDFIVVLRIMHVAMDPTLHLPTDDPT